MDGKADRFLIGVFLAFAVYFLASIAGSLRDIVHIMQQSVQ